MERCGKMWKDVERCGKMWKDVERCGKMWKDVERCGKMWKDVERCGKHETLGMVFLPSAEDHLPYPVEFRFHAELRVCNGTYLRWFWFLSTT